ncbi:MAG TPA: GNAT family N-acetyltransferase [Chthonomonadaceae bacterium]|nr:GNAT family N-acetyltransferase [Chthonomonadaceae bacterium]
MPNLRALTEDDLPAAMALVHAVGWNQTIDDWRRLLALEPSGCLGIEVEGRVVATATVVRYGRDLAWLGMVVTHPDHRRRGYARRLLAAAMAYSDARGVRTLKLDAADAGRPLYLAAGFRDEQPAERWRWEPGLLPGPCAGAPGDPGPWRNTRPGPQSWESAPPGPQVSGGPATDARGCPPSGLRSSASSTRGSNVRPAADRRGEPAQGGDERMSSLASGAPSGLGSLPETGAEPVRQLGPPELALDLQAIGADRGRLLAALGPPVCFDGGFVMQRSGGRARYLGPCVAGEAGPAAAALRAVLAEHADEPWVWDLLPANAAAAEIARGLGFAPFRRLTRMARGEPLATRDELVYALGGFELG